MAASADDRTAQLPEWVVDLAPITSRPELPPDSTKLLDVISSLPTEPNWAKKPPGRAASALGLVER